MFTGSERAGKLFIGVLESPGKVLDFLSIKEWEPWYYYYTVCYVIQERKDRPC